MRRNEILFSGNDRERENQTKKNVAAVDLGQRMRVTDAHSAYGQNTNAHIQIDTDNKKPSACPQENHQHTTNAMARLAHVAVTCDSIG